MKKKLLFFAIIFSLLLSGCAVSELPKTANEQTNGSTSELEPAVKKIMDLSNRQLTKIPETVFQQTSLEELDVSNNQLTGAIQAEIRNLKNLKILKAGNNLMTGVPAEIGQLTNLQILDLSNNRLTGLPYELGDLKNLKTLNISGNDYSTLDLNNITEKLPAGVNIIK
jgi:Leucine-rich repeat (LRR) protein